MTLPFEPRPDSPDADHLNTLLDAMRSGSRAPDAASPETTEAAALANAAGQLRGLVRLADAPAAAYLDDHPLHDRWEDIMTTAFPAAPAHAPTGEVYRPSAPVSNRTRKLAAPPVSSRLNTWLSAAIVTLMLLGTVGGAWWFGPGHGGSTGDGGIRLAAITQDDGTAIGSPQAESIAPAPLMDLLSAVPAEMPAPDMSPVRSWAYADIERHFADLGLTQEAIAEDRLLPLGMNAFGQLTWTSPLFTVAANDDELVSAIGFDPYTVQQVLVAGGVPDMLTLLRGDWNADTLTAAWEAAGYTEHTTESGLTIWSLGPDGEIDPNHPIQRTMFQQMNNVTILDGSILVYAGTMETVELAVTAYSGEVASARDDTDMAPLLATVPENTVSLTALDAPGTDIYTLDQQAEMNPNIRPEDAEKLLLPFEESRDAVGPMPTYHGAIFGLTSAPVEDGSTEATPASGTGTGTGNRTFIRLGADSEADAAQIVKVVEWRWDNFLMQRYPVPYSSVIELTGATPEGTTVLLDFDPMGNLTVWVEVLNWGGLSPLAVDPEDEGVSGTPGATPEE